MSELRHLLDDLAGAPAPAPRVSSDALFDAGRRRHRRRTVFALDTMAYALYRSADGRHWTEFPLML